MEMWDYLGFFVVAVVEIWEHLGKYIFCNMEMWDHLGLPSPFYWSTPLNGTERERRRTIEGEKEILD